jgi:membrane protein required for colicin V production
MNGFDAVVAAAMILGIALGFHAGLLRSLATIFGYLIAAPMAAAVTSPMKALVLGQSAPSPDRLWLLLAAVFIGLGIVVSALLRIVVSEFVGPDVGLFDRLAGAALGALRMFLIAVLIVVIFDRIVPPDRQPNYLVGSRLRPYLSAAGQAGLQSLPPDIEAYIDRLKRERGI